jgi:hypothetical protein
MSWIVTFMAAVLTTLVGVLAGSALGNRSQQRQWSRDRQADACAQVLRESSNVVIELAKLSIQRVEATPDGSSLPSMINWQPWNEALAMICLVADHDIVEAAQAIDAEIWPVHQVVKRGWTVDADWPRLQRPIEARREEFVNVARRRFAASGPSVSRITGKPAPNDPRWQFRRSDFGFDQDQAAREPSAAAEPDTTS